MAGKIIIHTERCKGCGLCVIACPRADLVISTQSNKKGYFPAMCTENNCSGCGCCAVACPEAAIEVYREEKIIEIRHSGKADRLTKQTVTSKAGRK